MWGTDSFRAPYFYAYDVQRVMIDMALTRDKLWQIAAMMTLLLLVSCRPENVDPNANCCAQQYASDFFDLVGTTAQWLTLPGRQSGRVGGLFLAGYLPVRYSNLGRSRAGI